LEQLDEVVRRQQREEPKAHPGGGAEFEQRMRGRFRHRADLFEGLGGGSLAAVLIPFL
jgi:hypothetical protein